MSLADHWTFGYLVRGYDPMAINTSNTDKGANGGPMPLQSPNDGASEWSRRPPHNEWKGGSRAAGPEVSNKRPTGEKPTGFPSKTPRC